jgi:outer membrane protein OmpA-like peptidoglycan-associated protein
MKSFKGLLLVLITTALSLNSFAQTELAIHGGVVTISGDIESEDDLLGYGVGMSLRKGITNTLSLRGDFIYGSRKNSERNLDVPTYSKFTNLSLDLIYSFPTKSKFDIYMFSGVSLIRPATIKTNVTRAGLNLGAGVGYRINEEVSLYIEPRVITGNDFIDGIGIKSNNNKYSDVVFYMPLRLAVNLPSKKEATIPSWWSNPIDTLAQDINTLKHLLIKSERKINMVESVVIKETIIVRDTIVTEPQVIKTTVDSLVFKSFDMLFFDNNSSEINDTSVIKDVVSFMKKYPTCSVTLEGYSSSNGTAKYNKKLSIVRCNVVAEELVQQGVNPNRLTLKSFGSEMSSGNSDVINRVVKIKLN